MLVCHALGRWRSGVVLRRCVVAVARSHIVRALRPFEGRSATRARSLSNGARADEGFCEIQQPAQLFQGRGRAALRFQLAEPFVGNDLEGVTGPDGTYTACQLLRSEEHTSELQSLMRISYAV